jgi:hypothetical protein
MIRTDSSLKIVWVEVGRALPRYAARNIVFTAKNHPFVEQILVTDSTANVKHAKIVRTQQIEESKLTQQFNSIRKEWAFKQRYFWQGTTARFFHLYDVMKSLNIENALHLETDCVLLAPESLNSIIRDTQIGLAYPLQAQEIGCASILYVRNHKALKQFLEFIIENWHREGVDDMTLLGEYSKKSYVKILPSKFEQGQNKSEYIFDAQSIGKFFLGTDARNCRLPFSRRGLGDSRAGSMTDDLLRSDLRWHVSRESKRLELNVQVSELEWKIANVHIHSKIISRFSLIMQIAFKLSFRRSRSWFWRLGFVDVAVLAERAVSFIARRVLRLENFEERNLR